MSASLTTGDSLEEESKLILSFGMTSEGSTLTVLYKDAFILFQKYQLGNLIDSCLEAVMF